MTRVYNFSAGPAIMPLPVLERAAAEMCDFQGTGQSVMEMSHRSPGYVAIAEGVEASLRRVMAIPDNYKVLFLQGGATGQFAGVPLNLCGPDDEADYAVTGYFSQKAYKEAQNYCNASIAMDKGDYATIPTLSAYNGENKKYFHYCMNNTVYGTVWPYIPQTGDVPLVCDMSSCILSEPVDVSRFGVIYAGAQKNMGPAGLTVVIVREDLCGNARKGTPSVLDYGLQAKNGSMLNTPSTYGIYLLGLVLDWVEAQGGLAAMAQKNRDKARLIYDALDSLDFYRGLSDKEIRSLMNVTFFCPTPELDAKFVKEAAARGLTTLKGYRAVGGIRASIYNAMPKEGCQTLSDFMKEFAKSNG